MMDPTWLASSPLELARHLEAMAERLLADAKVIRTTVAETQASVSNATDSEALLDIADLCDLLDVSRTALYSLRNSGDGPPFIRIGNRVRFRPQDVNAWLSERSERGR